MSYLQQKPCRAKTAGTAASRTPSYGIPAAVWARERARVPVPPTAATGSGWALQESLMAADDPPYRATHANHTSTLTVLCKRVRATGMSGVTAVPAGVAGTAGVPAFQGSPAKAPPGDADRSVRRPRPPGKGRGGRKSSTGLDDAAGVSTVAAAAAAAASPPPAVGASASGPGGGAAQAAPSEPEAAAAAALGPAGALGTAADVSGVDNAIDGLAGFGGPGGLAVCGSPVILPDAAGGIMLTSHSRRNSTGGGGPTSPALAAVLAAAGGGSFMGSPASPPPPVGSVRTSEAGDGVRIGVERSRLSMELGPSKLALEAGITTTAVATGASASASVAATQVSGGEAAAQSSHPSLVVPPPPQQDPARKASAGGAGGGSAGAADEESGALGMLSPCLPPPPRSAILESSPNAGDEASLQRQKTATGGEGEASGEEEPALRRQDAGADSYMLRIFGTAYTKVAGTDGDEGGGVLKVWLHPYSSVRMRLDMVWVAVGLLMSVVVPLQVAFVTPATALPYLVLLLVCSAAWAVNIAANFLTGYDEDGVVVMEAAAVRARYLRTWLLLDLLGALPYVAVPLADTWDIDIHKMRLVKLLGLAMVFTHLFACMSYFVQLLEGFPSDGWVVVNGLDGLGPWITYNFALLRSLQLVMGSNVDNVSTSSDVEVVFTIVCYIVGVFFYAMLIGVMSSIVLSLNRSGQMYVEKLQIWRDYCHYRRLPGELRRRVMAYINTAHSNKRVLDDTSMLLELSPGLRTDVNLQLCAELVATVPVFLECSPIVVRAMVSKLQRETHVAGDFVFRVGDIADAVYFILKGTVAISDETGQLLTRLAQGSHFGEFGILAYLDGQLGVRTAAARADDCVELYKLHCEDFAALVDDDDDGQSRGGGARAKVAAAHRLLSSSEEDGEGDDDDGYEDLLRADVALGSDLTVPGGGGGSVAGGGASGGTSPAGGTSGGLSPGGFPAGAKSQTGSALGPPPPAAASSGRGHGNSSSNTAAGGGGAGGSGHTSTHVSTDGRPSGSGPAPTSAAASGTGNGGGGGMTGLWQRLMKHKPAGKEAETFEMEGAPSFGSTAGGTGPRRNWPLTLRTTVG
eukprot:XP_001698324.1 predicted protein [Chlamydomonas reinhardtii]